MGVSELLKINNISKIIGGICVVLAIYLIIFTPYTNAALAYLLIGTLTIILLHDDFIDMNTSKAQLKSSFHPLDTLLTNLNVRNNGVYIPTRNDLDETRLFIPTGEAEIKRKKKGVLIIPGDSIFIEEKGVAFEPPGLPLFDEAKNQMKEEKSGEPCMTQLTESLNLAKSFKFTEKDNRYRLRITHGPYEDYCEDMRKKSKYVCERTACPLCSSYLIAAVEGLEKPLKIIDFKKEGHHVIFYLEEI